jgi:phosphoserine aminotransferase
MVPLDLMARGGPPDYVITGEWSAKAAREAARFGVRHIAAATPPDNHTCVPAQSDWQLHDDAAYVHYCSNETVHGVEYHWIPETGNVPLVADMSSDIFSGKHDYSKYSMIYAAAQKNLGTSGNCLVVIKRSFLDSIKNHLPPMLSYRDQVAEGSILNTANVSGMYVSLLMLRWIKDNGIERLGKDNQHKADMLYNLLDNSTLFEPHVKVKADRSLMNICFRAKDAEIEARFMELCNINGVLGVKGHRLVGGFRVSNYNAISIEWMEELIALMNQFENK